MSNSRDDVTYTHTLTAAELQAAALANPKATAAGPLTLKALYSDQTAGTIDNIATGLYECTRGTLVNGKNFDGKEKSSNREATIEFKNFIETELDIKPDSIDTSFSVAMSSLLNLPLTLSAEIGLQTERSYTPVHGESAPASNLYLNPEDKQVYHKAIATGYRYVQGETKIFISGPVEIVHKLQDGKFKLQHIKTNSDFLRDVFLGKEGVEKQLQGIISNHNQPSPTQRPSPSVKKQNMATAFFKSLFIRSKNNKPNKNESTTAPISSDEIKFIKSIREALPPKKSFSNATGINQLIALIDKKGTAVSLEELGNICEKRLLIKKANRLPETRELYDAISAYSKNNLSDAEKKRSLTAAINKYTSSKESSSPGSKGPSR